MAYQRFGGSLILPVGKERVTDMNSLKRFFIAPTRGPASILLIRLAVGLIFATQGILKYIDPNMGVVRFAKIGFPHPYFTAHFVGTFEILCGIFVLLGLWTRLTTLPLLIVISTAIATTKVPELFRTSQGLWFMISDGRTDFAMLCSLLFLILNGGGDWSLDSRSRKEHTSEVKP
jgi:putative oxidoreductase